MNLFNLGFLSRTLTNHRTAGEVERHFSLTPHYHFHPFHRHLGISRAITAESSPHSWQPDSNRERFLSERKLLTIELGTLKWKFFYLGFLSRTLTTHMTTGEGREPSFIPFYHFHPLRNIQTFILQLCAWDEYHMFLIAPLVFTRLVLDEIYHLIELLFDWLMMRLWFLFVYLLIWFKVFVTAIWHWKPVGSNSHRLSFLC